MKKINQVICLVFLALLTYSSAFSQQNLVKQWDHRFGGDSSDWLMCSRQTLDLGYIIGGFSNSKATGDKSQSPQGNYDYWVVKIDSNGIKQWDKTFGGLKADYLAELEPTKDKGYILVGTSYSGIGGDKSDALKSTSDFWVVKIDSLGNKEWDKDFGGTSTSYCGIYSVKQTTDGGYILGGLSNSGIGGDKSQPAWPGGFDGVDYWMIKLDASGNKVWDKDFGGTDDDYLAKIQQTSDGGYILAGSSYSGIGGDRTEASRGDGDYWIVKTDANGIKQWDKRYGSNGDDVMGAMQQSTDGGYILAGWSWFPADSSGDKSHDLFPNDAGIDWWVVKVDKNGVKEWDYDYGGDDWDDDLPSAIQTSDGGYLFGGATHSGIGYTKTEANLGLENTWILKTDAKGIRQWDKTLKLNDDNENGYVIETKNGCYTFANYNSVGINGDRTEPSRGGKDFWIIRYCDTTFVAAIPPQSNFQASDTTLCENDCIGMTNLSINATSYKWSFPGGTPSSSTDENPFLCYKNSGNYNITLIASNSGGDDTLTFTNYINVKAAPPTPVVNQVGTTLYCSTDPTYTSYQWYDSTALVPGATDTFLVITHGGNYNVQVTNENNCKIAVGINIVLANKNYYYNDHVLSLSPNPAADIIYVSGYSQSGKDALKIYNSLGEVCHQAGFEPGSNRTQAEINVSVLPPGLYFIEVVADHQRWVGRFVKE